MTGGPAFLLLALLACGLVAAAAMDWRSRIIPNWLNAAIALGALPFWLATRTPLWPDAAIHLAVAAAIFALFALAFHFGMMGGGDVKMLAALALWLPPLAAVQLIVIMSLAGGALTLAMVLRHRLSRAEGALEIPYGIAIAFAGLWLLGEPFLNQFVR
ncbi:MAG: prepilin peptidase [Alphaproteobacteria bacterium]|nr:prepilin peptidase [Alphaproteobacteria bacterium]